MPLSKSEQQELIHSIMCLFGLFLIIISLFTLEWIHLIAGTILLIFYGGLDDIVKIKMGGL